MNGIKCILVILKYNITDNLFSLVLEICKNFCCQSAHYKLNYIFQYLSNRVCFQYSNTIYKSVHYIFACIKLNWKQALKFQIKYINRRENLVFIAQNRSFFIWVIIIFNFMHAIKKPVWTYLQLNRSLVGQITQ